MMEVVFEVADPSCPLTRFVQGGVDVRGVCRIMDTGGEQGRYSALVTLVGPDNALTGAVKTILNDEISADVAVVSETPDVRVLKMTWRGSAFGRAGGIPVRTAHALTHVFGRDALIEPMLLAHGHIRVRCLIPQPFDTTSVIRNLQDVQHRLGVDHFRVIRVNAFTATQYADVLRRILTPDEEDLLRIALDLGYYETPKRCTLEAIANRVGLSVSPVHKRLKNVEQTLINAHVSPGSARPPPVRRRGARRHTLAPVSGPREIAVRVRWPSYIGTALTARHPGARVIVQPVHGPSEAGEHVALVIVAAPEEQYTPFVEALSQHPAVRSVDVLTRDVEHASLRIRTVSADAGTWATHPVPFAYLVDRFGAEAFLKPVVVEDQDVWLRFVVVRDAPGAASARVAPVATGPGVVAASGADHAVRGADVLGRLADYARVGHWEDVELVSLRALNESPVLSPVREPEKLTPRQAEILKIAHALGYYKTPRECTLGDIARTLGISANAIHKNLTAAEQKIIASYLTALD